MRRPGFPQLPSGAKIVGDHAERIRRLEFRKQRFPQVPYGYAIYVNRGGGDKITVPGDGTNSQVVFNSQFIASGDTITEFSSAGGFTIKRGLYHIFGSAHWGSADPGYEKTMAFGGLISSYVDGVVDLDGEYADTIPDNSSSYTNKSSVIFRWQDPIFATTTLTLEVNQTSGVNKDLQQAVLAVHRIHDY